MTRKARHFKHKTRFRPLMLTYYHLSLRFRTAATSFFSGKGTLSDWDALATCHNILAIAAGKENEQNIIDTCTFICRILAGLETELKAGRTPLLSEEDIGNLSVFLEINERFWTARSAQLLNACVKEATDQCFAEYGSTMLNEAVPVATP